MAMTAGNFARSAPMAIIASVAAFSAVELHPSGIVLALTSGVVTSGLGGVFPPGWPLGEAVDMTEEFGGLLSQVQLRPGVDFHRLEEVFILRPPPGAEPAAGGKGR